MEKKTIIAPESKKNRRVDVHSKEEDTASIRQNVAAHKRAVERFDAKQEFIYPLERITQSKLVIRNVKFPGADEAYPMPHQALMRFISAYYPYAKGGPLYVDEPKNDLENHRAYERQPLMKKLKHRYVIVDKDTSYENLLEQLGEI